MSSKEGCFAKFMNDIRQRGRRVLRRLYPKFLKRRSKKRSFSNDKEFCSEKSSPSASNVLSAPEGKENETAPSKVVATVEVVNHTRETENGVSFHTSDVEDEVGAEEVKLDREETRFDVRETIEEDFREDDTSSKVYMTDEFTGASLECQKDNLSTRSPDMEDIPKNRNEKEEQEKCADNANGQCINESATKDTTVSEENAVAQPLLVNIVEKKQRKEHEMEQKQVANYEQGEASGNLQGETFDKKRKEPSEDESRDLAEQEQIDVIRNEHENAKEEQRHVAEKVQNELLCSTLKESIEDKRIKTEESGHHEREKERQTSENSLKEQSQKVSFTNCLTGETTEKKMLSTFIPMVMIIILIILENMFIGEA